MGFKIRMNSNSFIALRVSIVEIIGVTGIDSAGGLMPMCCTDTVVRDVCKNLFCAQHLTPKHQKCDDLTLSGVPLHALSFNLQLK